MKVEMYCRMAVPWYHSLVWWFRSFYPFVVHVLNDANKEVAYKSFRCKWLANRYLNKLKVIE